MDSEGQGRLPKTRTRAPEWKRVTPSQRPKQLWKQARSYCMSWETLQHQKKSLTPTDGIQGNRKGSGNPAERDQTPTDAQWAANCANHNHFQALKLQQENYWHKLLTTVHGIKPFSSTSTASMLRRVQTAGGFASLEIRSVWCTCRAVSWFQDHFRVNNRALLFHASHHLLDSVNIRKIHANAMVSICSYIL